MRKYLSYIRSFLSFLILFLKIDHKRNEVITEKKMLIVISSWMLTPVPFFTLIYAKLFHKLGADVKILHLYGDFSGSKVSAYIENTLIHLSVILCGLNKIKKSTKKSNLITDDVMERYAEFNTIWKLKSENSSDHEKEKQIELLKLKRFKRQLENYSLDDFDLVFAGGGVTGPTGLLYEICLLLNIQFSSFDSSSDETILFCCNGRAPKLDDLPLVLSEVKKNKLDIVQRLKAEASKEIMDRTLGSDTFKYQKDTVEITDEEYDYATFMNSTWDGAVLGSNIHLLIILFGSKKL